MTLRELRFPGAGTADWISRVDVALCFSPAAGSDFRMHVLREEPRCLLMHRRHPLACRSELRVQELLDEEFCGLHPSVDPGWAGLWSLDDHRGEPAPRLTRDGAGSFMEMVAATSTTRCVSVLPMVVARSIAGEAGKLVARRIVDASPATCTLTWLASGENALTAAFGRAAADEWADSQDSRLAA